MTTIADQYPTIPDVIAMLKRRINRAGADIDDLIEDLMFEALNELNSICPIVILASFDTVADTQAYTPAPAGLREIRRVYWPIPEECERLFWSTLEPYAGLWGPGVGPFGERWLPEAGMVMARQQQHDWLRLSVGQGWQLSSGNKTVFLMPKPCRVHTVMYSYYKARFTSVLEINDWYIKTFVMLCVIGLMEAMGNGDSAIRQLVDSQEGTAITMGTADSYLRTAKSMKEQLTARLCFNPDPPLPFP